MATATYPRWTHMNGADMANKYNAACEAAALHVAREQDASVDHVLFSDTAHRNVAAYRKTADGYERVDNIDWAPLKNMPTSDDWQA